MVSIFEHYFRVICIAQAILAFGGEEGWRRGEDAKSG